MICTGCKRFKMGLWLPWLPLLLMVTVPHSAADHTHPRFTPLSVNTIKHRVKRADLLNPTWNTTATDKLKRDLMSNYDKFIRPSINKNATNVKFDPKINHLELDEATSVLTIHCWVKMSWVDEKLTWDKKSYGDLTTLHLPDHEIWQPDVVPYNSAVGSKIDQYGNTHAIVFNSGSVIWVPPATLKVFCELDLRKWPFDTQECMLKVGSWTYSGQEINLNYSDTDPELDGYIKNAEWAFVGMERYRNVKLYSCCEEPYVDLVFNITLVRQSPIFKTLIITPITAIVFMTLATFWLPAGSSEKITLGGTTALIISLFMLYFTQKISVMSGHTPYVVSFYASSLYLVAFSVVFSVLVINLANSPRYSPVPWIIKSHLNGWIGRILLLNTDIKSKSNDDDSSPVIEGEAGASSCGQNNYSREWLLLATAIDRLLFLLYCFIFICFAISFLS